MVSVNKKLQLLGIKVVENMDDLGKIYWWHLESEMRRYLGIYSCSTGFLYFSRIFKASISTCLCFYIVTEDVEKLKTINVPYAIFLSQMVGNNECI
jgi:hypothetical protein